MKCATVDQRGEILPEVSIPQVCTLHSNTVCIEITGKRSQLIDHDALLYNGVVHLRMTFMFLWHRVMSLMCC